MGYGEGALGMCIVNGEAFDAGIASVPTPIAESQDDRWIHHSYWWWVVKVDTYPQMECHREVIDVKAMRKIEVGDVLIWVMESLVSTVSTTYYLNMRTLAKLH